MSTQNQKTIFITGSSSGLGRATAKLFASNGWKVIATMRNPDKETELNKLAGVAQPCNASADRRRSVSQSHGPTIFREVSKLIR